MSQLLEEARDIRNYIDDQGILGRDVEVMDWLIQQAQRVEELEKENKKLKLFYEQLHRDYFGEEDLCGHRKNSTNHKGYDS